ncbi:MAG: alpha/beta hydrolase [Rhizomicrobium sp.]
MALHPRIVSLLDTLDQIGFPKIGSMSAPQMRAFLAQMEAAAPAGPEIYKVEDVVIPGPAGDVGARLYLPTQTPAAIIVYFHGGGWTLGTLNGYDSILRKLALASDTSVLSIDYRLAPEHIFPAALEDAMAATRWAFAGRHAFAVPGAKFLVAGDSAGGNLAAVISQCARGKKDFSISGQILIYPCLDGDIDAPAMKKFEAPILTRDELSWFYDQYIPNRAQRSDPRFAPIRNHDLGHLPPAYIASAEYDLLRDEGERYAEKLQQAGNHVRSVLYSGMIHGFFALGDIPQAASLCDDIGAFIRTLPKT